MIVTAIARPTTLAASLAEVRALALRYPGEHELRVKVGERRLAFAEGVDVCADVVAELEELDFIVEVVA